MVGRDGNVLTVVTVWTDWIVILKAKVGVKEKENVQPSRGWL